MGFVVLNVRVRSLGARERLSLIPASLRPAGATPLSAPERGARAQREAPPGAERLLSGAEGLEVRLPLLAPLRLALLHEGGDALFAVRRLEELVLQLALVGEGLVQRQGHAFRQRPLH